MSGKPRRCSHVTYQKLPALAAAVYQATLYEKGELWELQYQGRELHWSQSLTDAVSRIEWHMCNTAIGRRHDLLHVHGAALCGPNSSLLIPGGSGVGKTTLALALALSGLRLLSDDVVFLHTDTWQPEPFPRAFHVHEDTLQRLAALGLTFAPEERIDGYLCSTALGAADTRPGPPLGYIVLLERDPSARPVLEPLSGAEATVEMMKVSKNLRYQPRFGLDLMTNLLEQAECLILRRDDDLEAAAGVVMELLQRGR